MILLGKTVTVTGSTQPDQVGMRGTVIDDGRDTLRIRTGDGSEKLLVKRTLTVSVDGHELGPTELAGTHAQRLKR